MRCLLFKKNIFLLVQVSDLSRFSSNLQICTSLKIENNH